MIYNKKITIEICGKISGGKGTKYLPFFTLTIYYFFKRRTWLILFLRCYEIICYCVLNKITVFFFVYFVQNFVYLVVNIFYRKGRKELRKGRYFSLRTLRETLRTLRFSIHLNTNHTKKNEVSEKF